jgi:hypothetical protein
MAILRFYVSRVGRRISLSLTGRSARAKIDRSPDSLEKREPEPWGKGAAGRGEGE